MRLVIYQQTDGTNSNADTNVYATEVLGVFNTGISEYATNVWDHIWNADDVGTDVDVAAPEGFTSVNKVTWSGTNASNYWPSNKVNASTEISAYSDLWFAMKVENTDIWCEGIGNYTSGGWLYFHLYQNSDGTWSKAFRSADGWYNDSKQQNLNYTNLKNLLEYLGGGEYFRGSYPNWVASGVEGVVYTTNVVGVLKCTGEHSADKIVANGDGTHDVLCRCGTVVSDNVACSGGTATCQSGAICSVCGYEYTGTTDHTGGEATCEQGAICTVCGTEYTEALGHTVANYTSNGNGTHNAVCACGAVIESNIACSGGVGTCLSDATCSLCGGSYETDAGHNVAWDGTTGTCTICGETFYDTGISSAATVVWDHIWNPYYFTGGGGAEGAYSDMAAPAGFDKVSEYTCSTKDFANKMGRFNASDISAYSDLWFAIKAVNVTEDGDAYVYLQGAPDSGYKGSEWVYVHYHQVSDGNWTKDYRTVDGYYSPSTNHTGITGTKLTDMISWKSGINQGSYPTATTGNVYTGYFTNVIGVLKCDGSNHTKFEAVSNGDGTHTWYCSCGEIAESNVACAGGTVNCLYGAYCADCGYEYQVATGEHTGGETTCQSGAICTVCGTEYTEAIDHNAAWDGNTYVCSVCGDEVGSVTTNLSEVTDVALFTDATYAASGASATGAFDATVATPANIDLSGFVDGLTISSISNVALNGEPYAVSSLANNVLTISVIPYEVYGEYTLTATITVEDKDFEVEMPILVITDLITSNAGLMNVRKVLRGPDSATYTATATYNDTELRAFGGKGGIGTMNGMGYYKLGANITMSEIIIGEKHTEDYTQQLTYVFGTPTVPFTGTFDGAGYILNNYKSVKSPYNTPTIDGVATRINLVQDVSQITETSAGTTYENEPSLFGYMNGLVKNLAITNAQFGQYGNIVLTGNGTMENVYLDVANLQATRYNSSGENLSAIVAPLLQRASGTNMTLRNVVIDLNDAAFSGTDATISTHYPALIGHGLGAAQNVAVYGFDTAWINAAGTLGNVYKEGSDGSEVDIYVKYADGSTNGASFLQIALSDDIWKIVDGVPYLKNVSVSGTESAPSESNDAVAPEAGVEYSIVWTDNAVPSYETAQFIKSTTTSAFGEGALGVNVANLSDFSTKQIIIGSYETYGKYVNHDALVDGATDYGVYTVENTIFVLSETEDGLMFAAKELCRRLYGWNQLTYLAYDSEAIVLNGVTEIDTSLVGNYTTQFAFEHRDPANDTGLTTVEKNDFGFTPGSAYTNFVEMHNSADYFGVTSATSDDLSYVPEWSVEETSTFATSGGSLITNSNGNTQYQLCYTGHGDATTFWAMVDQVVNVIKNKKAAVPSMKVINLMVEDNTASCECTECAKYAPSVTQLLFLNAVQKQLNKQGVGVGIEFFAYNAYSFAPGLDTDASSNLTSFVNTLNASAGSHEPITVSTASVDYSEYSLSYTPSVGTKVSVLMAEDGLRLWWTTHEMNHSFPMEHVANAHIYPSLLAWIASIGGKNIDVFAYQVSYRNYFFPLNTWEYQILYYQTLHKLGVNSYMFNLGDVHNNADKQTAFSAFKTYIDSRAQADVNVTFEQLKDEFFAENGYYGAGGPTMRTFFEELVAVYESRKQNLDATTDFVDPTANVQISTTGDTTGYIATWLYNNADKYYDADDFSNYYACVRQGFFNGSYGWNLTAMVFGGRQSSYSNMAPDTNVYVYGNLTQQATLEQWYNYCATALTAVSGEATYTSEEVAKYTKRIQLEQLMPEYLYLVYYSQYTAGSSDSAPSVSYTFPTASTVIATSSYQDFYNRVDGLGMLNPSEFYEFGETGDIQVVYEKAGWLGSYTYRYMYENFFKNWNVTVS
ncbi:MAG: DUF4838 domain-containing protein [Clostridia bacterium]|nr:DUF4838 domain-containing protein [Clostridia bacterium]